MQSISPKLILSYPVKAEKTSKSAEKMNKILSEINFKDRKVKGMLKSIAGLVYFVTLIYFLTVLLT